jgi:hypothetical protein
MKSNKKTPSLLLLLLILVTSPSVNSPLRGQAKDRNPSDALVRISKRFCKLFDLAPTENLAVRTEALLYIPDEGESRVDGGGESILYSVECNSQDNFALVDFTRNEDSERIEKLAKTANSTQGGRVVRIDFAGTMDVTLIPAYGHLGWLRANINIGKIYRAKLLGVDSPKPDFEATDPILEKGRSLQALNSNVVFSAFGRGPTRPDVERMVNDHSLIEIGGKSLSAKDFVQIAEQPQTGEFSLNLKEVRIVQGSWRVVGFVTHTDAKVSKRYTYEIEYLPQDDNLWKLKSFKLKVVNQ